MRIDSRLGVLAVALAAVAGCGGGSGSSVGSCNFATAGFCIDYSGNLTADQVTQLQTQACQANGGTFSTGACPSAQASGSRIGTCTVTAQGSPVTQAVRVYPAANVTAQDAQQQCTAGVIGGATGGFAGTWTNG